MNINHTSTLRFLTNGVKESVGAGDIAAIAAMTGFLFGMAILLAIIITPYL